MLINLCLPLGPLQTNCYLLADSESGEAAVVDPAGEAEVILNETRRRGWRLTQLWVTHAHFDHIGAAADLTRRLDPAPLIALHPAERPLWDAGGGAALFGFSLPPSPPPNLDLVHGQTLSLGRFRFEARHTPGHSPGHCVFYCAENAVCFCGDLIFRGGVGRTDLPGGSWEALIESIRTQIFTLPEETRLLSGHGPETTVGEEKMFNPFL
ncbi:MAG: MBL fold metallo-hydrolase [Candidatus Villigracilaceae bacterium]